jgi:hypothetical protein
MTLATGRAGWQRKNSLARFQKAEHAGVLPWVTGAHNAIEIID